MPTRIYTVSNGSHEVEFEWDGDGDPTEADIEQVFSSVPQGPAGGGFVPPKPGLPDPRQQQRPQVPAFKVGDPQGATEPTFGERFTEAAYQTGPTRLVEPDNIGGTAGAVTGAGLMATGFGAPFAIPAAMAVTGAVSKGLGGRTSYGERLGNSDQDMDVLRDVALEGAGGLVGAAVPKVASRVGRAMYRGGLRAVSDNPAVEDQLVETGIREGITVGRAGANKLQGTIKRLGAEVRKTLEAIDDQTINPETALSNVRRLRSAMEAQGAQPGELQAVDNVLETYTSRFGKGLRPTEAQTTKVGIYERNAPQYDSDKLAGAGKRAEMEFASGLREGLEETSAAAGTPVKATNQRLAQLYDLQEAVTSARKSGASVQPGDITSLAFTGAPYTVARAGLRAKPLTYVGGKLARFGDRLDVGNVGPYFEDTERNALDRVANVARQTELARTRADIATKRAPSNFDTQVPIERPGEDFVLGAQAADIPMEQHTWASTADEALWEARAREGSTRELATIPPRGGVGSPTSGGGFGASRTPIAPSGPTAQGSFGSAQTPAQWARQAPSVEPSMGNTGPEFHGVTAGDPVQGFAGRPRPSQPVQANQAIDTEALLRESEALDQADELARSAQNVPYEQQLDEGGPIANSSGVTDVSREAVNAADQWDYFVVKAGKTPRPLVGIRPEDMSLNPGERLARRPKGTSDRLMLY